MSTSICPIRAAREAGISDLPGVATALTSGRMPWAGGLLDQPAIVMDAASVYHSEAEKQKRNG